MRWCLIDRLVDCEPGVSALGIKVFSRSELFFMDHFHGFPIVPGVLQIEMMATTGGKAIKIAHPEWLPVLGSVKNAKFYRNIVPGDQCFIHVTVTRLKQTYSVVDAQVTVDGKKVSSAQIIYAILSAEVLDPNWIDPVIKEWRQRSEAQALLKSAAPESAGSASEVSP